MSAPKAIGSTWVSYYKGKEWPVVLCDDKHPPEAFIEKRPNPFLCPAILLGKHIFIWVRVNDLTEFDPAKDYAEGLPRFEYEDPVAADEEHVVQEKLRRMAFRVDAVQYEGAEYWCEHIQLISESRKADNEMRRTQPRDLFNEAEAELQQRVRAKSMRRERRASAAALPTPESMTRKRKNSNEVRDTIETIDDSDDEFVFVRDSERLSDPFQSNDDEGYGGDQGDEEDARLERRRKKNLKRVEKNLPPIDHCTIFIGEEHTPFIASRVAIGKCHFLSDCEVFEEEVGSHIKLYENADIDQDRFKPIHDYLTYGDFAPKFSRTFTRDRFEETIFLPDHRDRAAQEIIVVYHTAAKIQFEDVQRLCMRKLRLLDDLSPNALLVVVRIAQNTERYGSDVDQEMFDWLVKEVSRQFWKLVENTYMTFSRVMRDDPGFSKRVFSELAHNPAYASGGYYDD